MHSIMGGTMKNKARKAYTATFVAPVSAAIRNAKISAIRIKANTHDNPPTIFLFLSLLLSLSSAFLPMVHFLFGFHPQK